MSPQKPCDRSRMAVEGFWRWSSGLNIGNADKAAWRAAGSHSEAISFITTQDLDYLPGTYLKQGTTFAEVEDTRTVRIQIAAPKSDVGEVKIGAKVSLRL